MRNLALVDDVLDIPTLGDFLSLGSAESRATLVVGTNVTWTDIPGCAVQFTTPASPFWLDFECGFEVVCKDTTTVVFAIWDGVNELERRVFTVLENVPAALGTAELCDRTVTIRRRVSDVAPGVAKVYRARILLIATQSLPDTTWVTSVWGDGQGGEKRSATLRAYRGN